MLALNAVEWTVLALWAGGVVGAYYAMGDDRPVVSRVAVVVLALVVPLVGSLVAILFALLRLRRRASTSTPA